MRPPKGVLNNDEPQETHRCIDSPGGCLLFEHRRLRERRGRGRGIGQQPGTQPRRRKPSPGFIAAQSYHGVVAADASQNMSPTGSGGTEAGFLVLYAFSEAPPASLTDDEVISFVRNDRGCSPVWTALRRPEPGPVVARNDRSRWLRAIGTDERQGVGRGQRVHSARPPGAVRTDEHRPCRIAGCSR